MRWGKMECRGGHQEVEVEVKRRKDSDIDMKTLLILPYRCCPCRCCCCCCCFAISIWCSDSDSDSDCGCFLNPVDLFLFFSIRLDDSNCVCDFKRFMIGTQSDIRFLGSVRSNNGVDFNSCNFIQLFDRLLNVSF